MKPTFKLWFAAVAAALVLSRDSTGAVREVPPAGVSTFLDAFPQTLRLRTTMGVGVLPSDTTWEFLAPGVRPTYMWVPITNGPSLALPLLQASDSGIYRAIAVDGWKADEAQVRVAVAGPAAEVDALRLQSPLQNAISALLSLPDGRVVRAGRFFTTGDGAGLGLALHRADGSRDPSWDGLADVSSINLFGDDTVLVVATQRTGGLVAGTLNGRIIRGDATGHWDVDFSNRNLSQSRVHLIEEDSVGRLVVGTAAGLKRLMPDGSPDPGFNYPAQLGDAAIQGLHVFPDDSMVVAYRTNSYDTAAPVVLAWLRANGSQDVDRTPIVFDGNSQSVNVMAALPDQSILLGGLFDGLAGTASPNLVRVTRAGVVDSMGGRRLPTDYFREIRRIIPLARGGFLIVAKNYVNGSSGVTTSLLWSDSSGRLRGLGLPDLRYGDIDAVAEDQSGRILLGGSFSYGEPGPQLQSSIRFFAVRLPDLFLDDVRLPIAQGNGRWLRAAAFRSSATGFAVGDGGRVFRTDDGGRSWSAIPTGVTNDLFAVALEGPVVDVAGSAGFYARRVDGTPDWNRLPTGVDATLRSMVGLPTGAGLVVGDSGTLLTRSNGTFAILDSGTTNDLLSIAGPVDQAFIAVRAGTILRLTTNGIAAIPSGTERDLTAIIDNSTALTDDGHVVWKGRVTQTQGSGLAYSAFRLIGGNLWAAGTNGVVEKDFALERALPSSAPIVALVPMGQHVHAYAADGASFVMRESQTNVFAGTSFALLSPTNGQQVVKSNGTFSLQSTGATVSASWLVQDRAQGGALVQNGNLGKGVFGPARLFVQAGDTLVGPVAINLVGPPELEGLGTPSQPLRLLSLENGSVEVAPAVTAGGPLVFEWFKNGRRLVGVTNPSLSMTGLSFAQAGTYQLIARSGSLSSTGAVTLIVTNASGATLLPRPPDQVLYARETIQFQFPQVAEVYRSASFVRVSDGKAVGVAPTNSTDSGFLKLVLTNFAGRIVGISEPAEILVRNVTNRTIILSAGPATTSYASISQNYSLIGYLAGGEESARFSLSTPPTHRLSGINKGFYFNATVVYFNGQPLRVPTNQIGVWFSFDSYYEPYLRGDRMGFSNPGYSGSAFTLYYATNGLNPSAPVFSTSLFALQVLSPNGSPLPARFFFAPAVGIDSTPARRSETSPLSNDVQLVTVTNYSFGRAERIRVRITALGKDSNGAPIRVANATGEDQFGPYLDVGPVEVGVGTNVVIRYVVPDGVTLPDPIIRVDWPESLVAAFPSSTFISLTPQGTPSGQRKLRFNTVRGWNYRVMDAAAVVGPWTSVSDAFPGNDSYIEWPIPPSPGPATHFWRVEVTPEGN